MRTDRTFTCHEFANGPRALTLVAVEHARNRGANSAGAQVVDLGSYDSAGAAIVTVKGDPIADVSELARVSFVMKGGAICKTDKCNL